MSHLIIRATIPEAYLCIQALQLSDISNYAVKTYREDGRWRSDLCVVCDAPEQVLEIIMQSEAFDPETTDWEIE